MESRRTLLKVAGLSAAGLPLFASEGQIPNRVISVANATVTRKPFGDESIFFQGPPAQLKSMTAGSLLLKPGMEPHPPHQHPEEEFMVVTQGHGEMLVGGKTTLVGPGSMLYYEGNHPHDVKNTGLEPLLFYFYKWQGMKQALP